MATWHTVASARDEWPDAPVDDDDGDDILTSLLAVAKEAVIAYAPTVTEPLIEIPDGYRDAQLVISQNNWNAKKQPSGFYDTDQTISAQWAPWHQLVRPKRGRPWVG
jgi:hypothetical protein